MLKFGIHKEKSQLGALHESEEGIHSLVHMCHVNALKIIPLLYFDNDWGDVQG